MKRRLKRKILAHPIDARGRTVYIARIWRGGTRYVYRRQICRMDAAAADGFWDDPITVMSGCGSEFGDDFRRRDRAEGCPACRGEL